MKKLLTKAGIIFAITVLTVVLDVPKKIIDYKEYLDNRVFSSKIYMNLVYQNYVLKLGFSGQPLITPFEIKPDTPVKIQFSLTQGNRNSPEITKIFLKFPPTAKVTPLPDEYGRKWRESNPGGSGWYFLDCSPEHPFTSDTVWDLPMFSVEFKELPMMILAYRIIGNRMDKIERGFRLYAGTNYKYTEEGIWCNFPRSCRGQEDSEGRLEIYNVRDGLIHGYYEPHATASTVVFTNRASQDARVVRTCVDTYPGKQENLEIPEEKK